MRSYMFTAIICLGFSITVRSNHIVGGEIELIHVNGFVYKLNLIQYFDDHQFVNPGPDSTLVIYFFKNKDNSFIESFELKIANVTEASAVNPECNNEEFEVLRVFYTSFISLDSAIYNDVEGYHAEEKDIDDRLLKSGAFPEGVRQDRAKAYAQFPLSSGITGILMHGVMHIGQYLIITKPL